MDIFVFDACSLIDLDDIEILDIILNKLTIDKLWISDENFNELDWRLKAKIKGKIDIFQSNETEFNTLRTLWKKDRIAGQSKDLHMLYVVEKIYPSIKTDNKIHVVSFDLGFKENVENYKNTYKRKELIFYTTIDLLNLIYIRDGMSYSEFINATLRLFKHKEISKYFKNLKTYQKDTYQKDIKDAEVLLTERFQIYKYHIVEHTKRLIG